MRKKELVLFFCLVLLIVPFTSASFLGDIFGKITGNVFGTGNACYWPVNSENPADIKAEHGQLMYINGYYEKRLLCWDGRWRATKNDWPDLLYADRNTGEIHAERASWGIVVPKDLNMDERFGGWKIVYNQQYSNPSFNAKWVNEGGECYWPLWERTSSKATQHNHVKEGDSRLLCYDGEWYKTKLNDFRSEDTDYNFMTALEDVIYKSSGSVIGDWKNNGNVWVNENTITPVCSNGETKCEEGFYSVCENNNWVNKGKVDGKCGYSEPSSECSAILYKDRNYLGESKIITSDTWWIGKPFNDVVSSLKISEGCSVSLHENTNYQGKSKTFSQDVSYVGNEINDLASSVKIFKTPEQEGVYYCDFDQDGYFSSTPSESVVRSYNPDSEEYENYLNLRIEEPEKSLFTSEDEIKFVWNEEDRINYIGYDFEIGGVTSAYIGEDAPREFIPDPLPASEEGYFATVSSLRIGARYDSSSVDFYIADLSKCLNVPGDDCDDNDARVDPGNPEACDGIDNNCDGVVDDVDYNCDGGISAFPDHQAILLNPYNGKKFSSVDEFTNQEKLFEMQEGTSLLMYEFRIAKADSGVEYDPIIRGGSPNTFLHRFQSKGEDFFSNPWVVAGDDDIISINGETSHDFDQNALNELLSPDEDWGIANGENYIVYAHTGTFTILLEYDSAIFTINKAPQKPVVQSSSRTITYNVGDSKPSYVLSSDVPADDAVYDDNGNLIRTRESYRFGISGGTSSASADSTTSSATVRPFGTGKFDSSDVGTYVLTPSVIDFWNFKGVEETGVNVNGDAITVRVVGDGSSCSSCGECGKGAFNICDREECEVECAWEDVCVFTPNFLGLGGSCSVYGEEPVEEPEEKYVDKNLDSDVLGQGTNIEYLYSPIRQEVSWILLECSHWPGDSWGNLYESDKDGNLGKLVAKCEDHAQPRSVILEANSYYALYCKSYSLSCDSSISFSGCKNCDGLECNADNCY